MTQASSDITRLLSAAASGERKDLDALMGALYADLRRLAVSHLGRERGNHTLQPTALVHEAYVKLVDQRNTAWKDRLHFFAVASRIIRRILIDHARARHAERRGGGRTMISIGERDVPAPEREVDLLALDEALEELAELDPQQAKIVELRYFSGCTVEEVAEIMGVGKRTVDRDWQAARAWLFVRLEGAENSTGGTQGDANGA
jgi:RNA polymerase sigma-70 factor, ECF subfamily